MIKYAKVDAIATITLNRPKKYNSLRIEMLEEFDIVLRDANRDNSIKVIILEGAGDSFCSGFDFSVGIEHFQTIKEQGYDPGTDVYEQVNNYTSWIPSAMDTTSINKF